MENFNTQPVVDILHDLCSVAEISEEKIDEAIDALEVIKGTIDIEDDEAIDKVDEIQDYLEYLLTDEDSSTEEVKDELGKIIINLQK